MENHTGTAPRPSAAVFRGLASDSARQLENLLAIGIALSSEKDHNKLLEMIITEAQRITNADAGTLYLVEDNHLKIKIIHNYSMNTFLGGKGEDVNLPPVPISTEYVSGYTAATGQPVNIPDVYRAKGFDFSGPCKYDQMTGYRTTSMLVIPLKNHLEEVIGVLQLINAIEPGSNNVVPFTPSFEPVIEALASLAAISLTNMQLIQEIETLFEAFVQVMVTTIDSQTPYNATHTQKVTRLCQLLAEEINAAETGSFAGFLFTDDQLKQLTMAGWLHDIGKIATPLEVMNKATRLDTSLPLVLQRLDLYLEQEKNRMLKHRLKLWSTGKGEETIALEKTDLERLKEIREIKQLVIKADNPATFVDQDLRHQLEAIARRAYHNDEENLLPLLTGEELTCLTIPRGTLTEAERQIMEDHVLVTEKMLSKIPFTKKLSQVPELARMHHEHLDGKGYPRQLIGDQIPLEARILAIADIFDALTASDRPYKKGMPAEKALTTMTDMVNEGKLDGDLLGLFGLSRLWEQL
jgi:HD-GYP domain-containing protein (c-di-GMP phosphodiesterase class II)